MHIGIAPRRRGSVQDLHDQLRGTLPCRWPQRACDGNPLGEVFVGTLEKGMEKSREKDDLQETMGFIWFYMVPYGFIMN